MRKNVGSQVVVAQLNSKTDGSAVTSGTTTVYYLGDGGTQTSGGGTVTHEGNGCWSYVPTQAETNYDHVAFTFVNTSAIIQTVQVWTGFPQTGDSYVRLGAPAAASIAADLLAIDNFVDDLEGRLTATRAGYLDNLSVAPPTAAAIRTEMDSNSTDFNTIIAYVDDLETRLTATRAGYLDNLDAAISTRATPAQVNTEVDTALADINLDHIAGTATAIPAIPAGTYIDQLMDDGTATFDRTTDSLQAIRDRGDSAWGGSGSADWTATERENIRNALGVDGTKTAPTGGYGRIGNPSSGSLAGDIDLVPTASEIQAEIEENGASVLDTIRDEVQNGTYGLSAIETLVDELETRLTAARAGYLDNIATAPPTAAQIQAEIEENGASVIDTIRDEIQNGTYGLSAIETLVDDLETRLTAARAGYLDNLAVAPPTAAAIRAEIDSNSTDLNTIIGYVDDLESRLTATRAGYLDSLTNLDVAISTRSSHTVDDILDEVVEATTTLRQAVRIMMAALAGKSTGGGTTSHTYRDIADAKARISATVDANGNRTAITRDGT